MFKIYCLQFRGRGLTGSVRDELFRLALAVVAKAMETEGYNFDTPISESSISPVCAAIVTTEFYFSSLGSISGLMFLAQVEDDRGKTEVEFLVGLRDLPPLISLN